MPYHLLRKEVRNLSARSTSGENLSLSSLSSLSSASWSASPPWPTAAGSSGGGETGAAPAPDEQIPAMAITVRAVRRSGEASARVGVWCRRALQDF